MHFYITDIDDCSTNPCGDNGACQDGVATYSCTCTDGYEGDNCETSRDSVRGRVCEFLWGGVSIIEDVDDVGNDNAAAVSGL
jgi:hypothetical protein